MKDWEELKSGFGHNLWRIHDNTRHPLKVNTRRLSAIRNVDNVAQKRNHNIIHKHFFKGGYR